ncbi:phage tail tape measure protein [Citrobacter freundii]|uniref:phage tail tape measure protein n=1 Tax=Enterobacteriaceae TaxID=543 RepID=UPI0004D3BF5D|nr:MULTISPECIES: phage tail tape measure protein [Enterobacteriaceae]QMF94727.1 phage tail tape measure protein [Citrobacter freundii]KDT00547.1 phage tail tape measure protein, TP901 family, core region [Escherichia coli 2-011-08_S4_C1]KDT13369.1 phage tail tape measure protein, TP901 family, core region [Escherichia coli 2-011-08_S4_C3]MBU3798816.1 phage tail tape measure protein [Citrobacter youngae]MEB7669000.1 phage tail tape measure protein [Escherichia coli]
MKDLNIRVAFSAIDKLTRPVNAARNSVGGLSESLKKTQSSIKDLETQSQAFNRLNERVKKTAQQLTTTQRAFDGLNKAQKTGTVLTDAQRERMTALAAKLDRLNASRSQETAKLQQASQALRAHGVSLAGGDRTIQSAIRRTEQYNQALERERRQLAAVTNARARYDRLSTTAGKLRTGGAMAVGASAGAGYAAGRFLAPAVGFDEEMSRVGALTRLDKGDEQFAALRAQAKKLGAETAFTTRDAASGQAFLAMAGFTPQSIQAALPGVLNMALAGGMDLGESADIGSNILTQFKLSSDQMDRVGDTLTAAFTRTNTDLRALGDTMKYAGPVAANLGISLEQASAMAGMLANNGLRGSDAGTALRSSLSRLASPPKAAADALKELGVSVADANGKMRPMETVLLDLFKATKKYGQVDQVSFFKNIAGEEAFVGLQTLVQAAGSGELQKLTKELQGAAGESATVAKKMADNLGGDLKELDSAWEAFRIQIEELADGALRKLTQALTGTIGVMTEWANKNPQLSKTLLAVGGSALALTAGIGATSLAIGLLLGPLAKLQLGFALLTSGSGLGGAVTLFSRLSGVISGPLGGVRGWGIVFSSMTGNAGKLAGALAPLRGLLAAAFISPGAALGGIVKGLSSLLLRLTGIPAIMGIASSALSVLGGALSLLLSPIGLIGAAFIATGLLIWRFWEPIKAFFAGFFAGVMQALTPFRDAFAGLAPVFDVISNAVSQLWQWFSNLLSPMTTSKETLDKCASAGETFGKVLGLAIQGLMLPLTGLANMIIWILKKLDIIPDGIDAAHAKAQALTKEPVAWEWDDKQKKMVKKEWNWSPKSDDKPAASTPPSPVIAADTGTQRRLQKIADNTGGMLDETKKRIGPGDIVFKNLPRALAVHGAWQEAQSAPGANLAQLSARPVIAAASAPIKPAAEVQAIGGQSSKQASKPAQNTAPDEMHIHIHMHGNLSNDARDIARMVADAVGAELNKRSRSGSSFRDKD